MSDLQNHTDIEIPESLMNIVVDEVTPQNAPLAAKYKKSYAYPSMKDRVPVILSNIVDNLYRDKVALAERYGEGSKEEIKQAIGEVSQLKNVLQTGKPFSLFTSSEPDTEIWNAHIQHLTDKGAKLNYYETDWLFAECYLFRSVREIFANKKYLKSLDPFEASKKRLINDSLAAILPLLKHLEDSKHFEKDHPVSSDDIQRELVQLFKCATWGNRLDLSLSSGFAVVPDNIFNIIEKWHSNILINDLERVLSIVTNPSKGNKKIEYVIDNAGMESLCDLCLADYLVTHCGVSEVKFRVKPIPWYISDVTITDFKYTLDTLTSHSDPVLRRFGERWKSFVQSGSWIVVSDTYWCLGLSFSKMVDEDANLYRELSLADLVIFKGDLNYRKLIQDLNWDPTTPFTVALGKFHPAPLVALRTNKADLACGLAEGVAETLNEKDTNWMISGDYAVIQFDSTEP